MSPMARTLARLRSQGFLAESVERWIPKILIRRDLFSIGDILAVHPGEGFLLVETTTASHLANRLAKVRSRPKLAF